MAAIVSPKLTPANGKQANGLPEQTLAGHRRVCSPEAATLTFKKLSTIFAQSFPEIAKREPSEMIPGLVGLIVTTATLIWAVFFIYSAGIKSPPFRN
jgi:hypothetical protein